MGTQLPPRRGNGHIDPAPHGKGYSSPLPLLGSCLLWPNGWMDQDATWYEVGLGPGAIVLDGDPAPPPRKGAQQPPLLLDFSAHCSGTVPHISTCWALVKTQIHVIIYCIGARHYAQMCYCCCIVINSLHLLLHLLDLNTLFVVVRLPLCFLLSCSLIYLCAQFFLYQASCSTTNTA